jgi:hypothetical protein
VDEIWLSRISGDYEGDVFLPHFEDSFIEEETTEFDTFRFTRYMSSYFFDYRETNTLISS